MNGTPDGHLVAVIIWVAIMLGMLLLIAAVRMGEKPDDEPEDDE